MQLGKPPVSAEKLPHPDIFAVFYSYKILKWVLDRYKTPELDDLAA